MILLAMTLALQAAPAPPAEDDIVVTGERMARLQHLRITTKRDRRTGAIGCVFKRRSGDPALDAAACDAVLACIPRVQTVQEMQACVTPAMNALIHPPLPGRKGPGVGGRPREGQR